MGKNSDDSILPPLLRSKEFGESSVFLAENLMREGRRQLGKRDGRVPEICILDPDGDVVRHLRRGGVGRESECWACYHTELIEFEWEEIQLGVVGFAVGAPFAVLVAEELFASGCELLISMTSAGQIVAAGPTPYFVLIERALRDEGTSYHYLPPGDYAEADPALLSLMVGAFEGLPEPVHSGAAWTTDAPFRETETAIEVALEAGILAVEMEAAALYAFSAARRKPILCFAHVTNQMAVEEGDFEKGAAGGSLDALAVIAATVRRWRV